MNSKSFYCNFSLVILMTVALLAGIGGQSWAVIWTEDFSGYANTAALTAAYSQSTNVGGQSALPASNSLSLATDGTSGNIARMTIVPSQSPNAGSNWVSFVWLYVGATNPFPASTFQNGTDFNVYWEYRQSALWPDGSSYWKTGGVATCVPPTYLTDGTKCMLATSGQQNNSLTDWSQSLIFFNPINRHRGLCNAYNGNVGTIPNTFFNPYLMNAGIWYSMRLFVDWPTNGSTTNDSVTCYLRIWQRGTSEPGTSTVTWQVPFASNPAGNLVMPVTGDKYGLFGRFQGTDATGYSWDVDNVVFEDSLTPTSVNEWEKY